MVTLQQNKRRMEEMWWKCVILGRVIVVRERCSIRAIWICNDYEAFWSLSRLISYCNNHLQTAIAWYSSVLLWLFQFQCCFIICCAISTVMCFRRGKLLCLFQMANGWDVRCWDYREDMISTCHICEKQNNSKWFYHDNKGRKAKPT